MSSIRCLSDRAALEVEFAHVEEASPDRFAARVRTGLPPRSFDPRNWTTAIPTTRS